MSIKRKVSHPDLLGYLKFEVRYYDFKNNFYFNTHIFNCFSFYCVLILILGAAGFWKPLFWAVALSNLILLIFLYRKTLNFCRGITVVRRVPKFAREKRQIEIVYTIGNETAFPLRELEFVEEFDGVEEGQFKVILDKPLRPHTQVQVIKKITLNAGMGIKTFKPLSFNLEDELGIFDFKLHFFQTSEIEVYPFIEETPALKSAVSPDSIDYGFYELAKRGDSNLFIGVRDYRHGDPVKHINWRLSKKTQAVVVNEFEKNTNTFITLLLELDLKNQLGFGATSTWEKAKDLALSLSSHEIKKHNLIQVISNNLYIPFGTGKSQLALMEKHFTYHEMLSSEGGEHFRHLHDLPARGQVYYICPLITTTKISEAFLMLRKLKGMGQEISIFVLDPYAEMIQNMKGELKLGVLELERQTRLEFERIEKDFKSMGVSFTIIRVGQVDTLNEQLLLNARNLLEVK